MRRLAALAAALAVALVTTVSLVAAVAAPAVAAGGDGGDGGDGDDVTLRLVTHDSFAISKKVLRTFTKETGIEVEVLPSGDGGTALNQAILTKDDPIGDVLYGFDNTFLSRALEADILLPARSKNVANVPTELRLDPTDHAVPIDHGAVCVNYDKEWYRERDEKVPTDLDDLLEHPERLVVENPATSTPGLAFLLATIDRYGEDGWRAYWRKLSDGGVEVVNGWEEAYNGSFTAGEGDGDKPLVVSYASSPPAAVYYSDPQPKQSPIGTALGTCFDQVEFAGVLRGTEHPKEARALLDFMLSREFQEDIPLQMFVFPARSDADLPAVFERFADVPSDPATIPPGDIGVNREQWIDEWTDIVLR